MQKLTLGEVATVEQMSGISIDQIQEQGVPKGLAMAALVFVYQKRSNPDFTYDDALAMDMEEAAAILGED